jgi:sugar transferase EpsL
MIKRLFDLGLGLFLIIVFAPLMAFLALFIKLIMGSPVLYKQLRPGYMGQPFSLYKFRTMTDADKGYKSSADDEKRLTGLGRFLRKYSLDELPQLYNVIRGELSFVGPRPLLMQYLERYSPEQARRLEAKPGITGWAQVNGRNALSWEEKFSLDVWYVERQSFWLDLKILAITLIKVLRAEGISGDGSSTVQEFMGNSGINADDPAGKKEH